LFGIAQNVVRKKHRRRKFLGLFSIEQSEQLPDNRLADERLLQKELVDALKKLNDKQREAIVLFEISGFSIKEIAGMQQLSESGVKSNLKRGKEKLAKLLTEKTVEGINTQLVLERRPYGK
jgi:RNA polymerase sigma-70 factor, ECF subfamily